MNYTRSKAFHRMRLVLLVFVSAGVSAKLTTTAIRGLASSRTNDQVPISRERRRRHLVQESTCTLYQKCVTYPPTEEHPRGYHDDSWSCMLSREDSERLFGIQFVNIYDSEYIRPIIANATTGKSILSLSEAIVDADTYGESRMYIPNHAKVEVYDAVDERDLSNPEEGASNYNSQSRHLAKTKGTLNTLVIRVIDSNGIGPHANTAKMINDVFTDAVSLKTQMEACSYNSMRIQPFKGLTPSSKYVSNGVVDVTMDYDSGVGNATNSDGMSDAALSAAHETLGDLNDPRFDLIMVCFPPAKVKFLAYAYANNKFTFYHGMSSEWVTSQMHEIGHNIGLGHSGETGESNYGDDTGYMGSSKTRDDWRQCFNPQKSYQLRWYEDQTTSIDPLDMGSAKSSEFTLNGVSDYGKNKQALVVLRLEQKDHTPDFYIGYNRATGVNADTREDRDRITIVRKDKGDSPYEYGQSTKVTSLAPGEGDWIQDFNGSGKNIHVAFTGITDDGDARIMVLEDAYPPPYTGSCQNFTVEVVIGNDYAQDYSWVVVDKGGWGRVVSRSARFWNPNREYREVICLPKGSNDMTYRFSMEDKSGQGMGNGGYRVFDESGKELFEGSNEFRLDRKTIDHTIRVERSKCRNQTNRKFRTSKKSKRSKSCKSWAREKKCNLTVNVGENNGKSIADICKQSCKACKK